MTAARSPAIRASARRRFARPWLAAVACAFLAVNSATPAYAQDDEEMPDARLSGYEQEVVVGGGVALSYAIVAFLGAISVGITFKNANRSHLD